MLPNYQARSPFVLKHTTSLYYMCVCTYVTLYFDPKFLSLQVFFLFRAVTFLLDNIIIATISNFFLNFVYIGVKME